MMNFVSLLFVYVGLNMMYIFKFSLFFVLFFVWLMGNKMEMEIEMDISWLLF